MTHRFLQFLAVSTFGLLAFVMLPQAADAITLWHCCCTGSDASANCLQPINNTACPSTHPEQDRSVCQAKGFTELDSFGSLCHVAGDLECFYGSSCLSTEIFGYALPTEITADCTERENITPSPDPTPAEEDDTNTTPATFYNPLARTCDNGNVKGIKCVVKISGNIFKTFLGITGVLVLIMFLYGGFLLMVSGGEQGKVRKGQDTIVWAVLGVAVMFGAYILTEWVLNVVGV